MTTGDTQSLMEVVFVVRRTIMSFKSVKHLPLSRPVVVFLTAVLGRIEWAHFRFTCILHLWQFVEGVEVRYNLPLMQHVHIRPCSQPPNLQEESLAGSRSLNSTQLSPYLFPKAKSLCFSLGLLQLSRDPQPIRKTCVPQLIIFMLR